MLKYKVLRDSGISTSVEIPYKYWNINGDYMVFTTENNHDIKDGSSGKIVGKIRHNNISNEITEEFSFTENVSIVVENNPREFKIERFKEYPLYVREVIESNNGKIIYFTAPHFFKEGTTNTLTMYYVATNLSITKQDISVTYDTELSVKYSGLLPQQYELYRSDFRFEEANDVIVMVSNGSYEISIPIGNDFATNGLQTELIQEQFVETEINKAITPIVNMEKDVYEPIIKSIDEPINEIQINLHFRERESEDWLVKEGGYWNGYPEGNKNDVMVTFKTPEHQSDLLGFLDFSNSDVRYQKSSFKKSFVRLLFYDSNNQANQNLLYYSTVFLDSGKDFGKLVKYIDGEYQYPTYDEEGNIDGDKIRTGITVNSEPYSFRKSNGTIVSLSNKEDSFKENRRISSQFTVKDKFNADASSEGFYLYMFAEEDPNLRHKSIYMKVEFNHAKYGRTIPFMRPTDFNLDTLENGKSKKIDEIINDCKPKDGDTDGGYDLETYFIHTYIQFKCGYSKKLGKHVYYLANEDDLSIDTENRKLMLNLYEAKVR